MAGGTVDGRTIVNSLSCITEKLDKIEDLVDALQNDNGMQIFVKRLNNQSFTVEARLSDSIAIVKAKIWTQQGIMP